MIVGPHNCGSTPVTRLKSASSTRASSCLAGGSTAPMKSGTLTPVGIVTASAMLAIYRRIDTPQPVWPKPQDRSGGGAPPMWLLNKMLKRLIRNGRFVVTDHDAKRYEYGPGRDAALGDA